MEKGNSLTLQKGARIGLFIILWAVIAWLLYPLLILDSVNMVNAKEYLYRLAIGITMMIIMFGKTITDLLFPLDISHKKALSYTIFLTIYSLVLLGGIIYMIARVMLVYLKSSSSTNTGVPF
jgi:hypothetical protein